MHCMGILSLCFEVDIVLLSFYEISSKLCVGLDWPTRVPNDHLVSPGSDTIMGPKGLDTVFIVITGLANARCLRCHPL